MISTREKSPGSLALKRSERGALIRTMNTNSPKKKSGFLKWLQQLWWHLRDLYRELRPCRFSVIVLVIAYLIFLHVAQGTEVLRRVAEGSVADPRYEWVRLWLFFISLVLWAGCSWYAARVLLSFQTPGSARVAEPSPFWDKVSQFAVTHLPRIVGIGPILIVGYGFLAASRSYDAAAPARRWFYIFGGLCLALAVVFYLLLILRRKMLRSDPARKLEGADKIGGDTLTAIRVIALFSVVLLVVFTVWPVPVAQSLGMGTILLVAAASWVAFGSFLVFLSGLWRVPMLGLLLVVAMLCSFCNDNHFIRVSPPREVRRADVLESFRAWYALAEKNYGAGVMHPLYLVATEGGGIRAAYWTATVLGGIQDANPNFAPHLFTISGVSGGSLGAAVFAALLAEPNPGPFKEKANLILGQDFLSPTLASMLYPDLFQRFIPYPIGYFDRARSLEMSWERAWRDTMHNDRFADSFVALWEPAPGHREWMPSLFLNGTSVEKGNRIITSNLRLTNIFLDADDAAEKLATEKTPATKAACNIPVSTAALMSARFTYVSPAGRFPDGTHVVDGGYFENSGATTAYEIATRLKDVCAREKIENVDIKVIMISNDPRKPPIGPARAQSEQEGRTESVLKRGQFMGEVMAPIYSLLNTRNARGTYAQKAIGREQRRFKAGVIEAPLEMELPQTSAKNIFYFKLRDTRVPLPLGWMLSAAAAESMTSQLDQDDDVIQNGSTLREIIGTLPPIP